MHKQSSYPLTEAYRDKYGFTSVMRYCTRLLDEYEALPLEGDATEQPIVEAMNEMVI